MQNDSEKYKMKGNVPEPTLRRMPIYLHYLGKVCEKGLLNISAPVMGKDLNYDPTQVVKDLAYTGVKGTPRIGYNAYELIHTIENFLGLNRINKAFLVGAGNLGSAIMTYQSGQGFGLKIVAAFDVDENKIGTLKGNVQVLHLNKFKDLVERLDVSIGILTTPEAVAQKTAEDMVKWGIKAIWNFTPAYLKLPDNIIIQNTSMYSNVAVLLKKLYDLETQKDQSEDQ